MQLTRETRGEMKIPCKHCHFVTRYSVSYIEDAICEGLQLTCSVCEEKFKVVVMPLDTLAAQHHAHLTPESLASSQAVVNASALEQSDSVPPPAQAQVA